MGQAVAEHEFAEAVVVGQHDVAFAVGDREHGTVGDAGWVVDRDDGDAVAQVAEVGSEPPVGVLVEQEPHTTGWAASRCQPCRLERTTPRSRAMSMDHAPTPLTRAAHDALQRELEHLRTTGRQDVAEQLRDAREAELDQDEEVVPALEAARASQSFLEGRIQQLEQTLATATIIDEAAVQQSDTVLLGGVVVVVEQAGG